MDVMPKPESIKLHFIEIPVFIRYKILNRKFGLYADAGITSGCLTNSVRSIYGGNISTNKLQFGGQAGLGISVDIGKKINLSLSSDFRQSFTHILVGSDLKLHSVGIITGIMYKIN